MRAASLVIWRQRFSRSRFSPVRYLQASFYKIVKALRGLKGDVSVMVVLNATEQLVFGIHPANDCLVVRQRVCPIQLLAFLADDHEVARMIRFKKLEFSAEPGDAVFVARLLAIVCKTAMSGDTVVPDNVCEALVILSSFELLMQCLLSYLTAAPFPVRRASF